MNTYIKLAVSLSAPLIAGFLGSFFTAPAIDSWYGALVKPWFTPPNWLFGPAWTALYLAMGIALYLVWTSNGDKVQKKIAISVFLGHLFLNAAWSIIFFGLQSPFWGLIEIAILFVSIVWTAILFARVRAAAGILFIPYIMWVSFASALNFSIWELNRPYPEDVERVSELTESVNESCEALSGIKIGDRILWKGTVLFNAADGKWHVIERIPKNEKFPYVYAHWNNPRGTQYSGEVLLEGTVTGFDPEDRMVFFYNYPCLADVSISALTPQ